LTEETQQAWLRLWAKTNRDRNKHDLPESLYHPFICHMLDVSAVADLLWNECLHRGLRKRLESALPSEAFHQQITFLAGVHDLGKACPGFQKQLPGIASCSGLPFSENNLKRPHGIISTYSLIKELGPSPVSTLLAQIIGAHHGVFPRSAEIQQIGRDTLGNKWWDIARKELIQRLAKVLGVDLEKMAQSLDEIMDPAVVPLLAGFISVADWIGSNQEFFPCATGVENETPIDIAEYWKRAQVQARNALLRLGWMPAVKFAREAPFEQVFNGFTPNALQRVAIELASKQTSPFLMVIEAPMGLGKTEAALYAADMAMSRGFARGLYVAMPTQATGNAMYARVMNEYLKNRGHQGKLNLQLIHGDALLSVMADPKAGEIREFMPKDIGDRADMEAQSWFTAKKRPLLSPFGIGTIDQSLLSVLQTKHWFVRIFGLAGKVVIFDEVHAYDTYMNTILERLLQWLAEIDCTVILLSATLPATRRKALVKSYSGKYPDKQKAYPRITMATPRHFSASRKNIPPDCVGIPMGAQREVHLSFIQNNFSLLAANLDRRLNNGGCAVVICNTVNRAIEFYRFLSKGLANIECSLFHARTLKKWRREKEEEVLRKFGKGLRQFDGTYKNPDRPHRAILVATQVIEQSLDLDFDLMVSEIAPIDLLLQRSGRLHRHSRTRPQDLGEPVFMVVSDAETNGPPPESFGKSIEFVYDRYILLRTWFTIRQREQLQLPAEIERLVAAVYVDESPPCDVCWDAELCKAKEQMELDRSESEKAAAKILVCQPKHPSDLLEEFNFQLVDDEDPDVHKTIRAATRESDPSITVVMLPEDYNLKYDPEISEIRELLDNSAKINHRGLLRSIMVKSETPKEWARNAHLRNARLLRINGNGRVDLGEYKVTVNNKLGILIEKNGESDG